MQTYMYGTNSKSYKMSSENGTNSVRWTVCLQSCEDGITSIARWMVYLKSSEDGTASIAYKMNSFSMKLAV